MARLALLALSAPPQNANNARSATGRTEINHYICKPKIVRYGTVDEIG